MPHPSHSWRRYAGALLCLASAISQSAWSKPEHGTQFQDWTIFCNDEDGNPTTCHMSQQLALKESRQRIMHFQVAYVPATEEPVAIVTLPLGISLPKGVSISIDGGEPARFPIERCEVNGCSSAFRLNPDLLDEFLRGLDAIVLFYDDQRKPLEVPLSLRGFTKGLDALQAD